MVKVGKTVQRFYPLTLVSSSLWSTGWRPWVADWGVVCLLSALQVQLFSSTYSGWPHKLLMHHSIISSC